MTADHDLPRLEGAEGPTHASPPTDGADSGVRAVGDTAGAAGDAAVEVVEIVEAVEPLAVRKSAACRAYLASLSNPELYDEDLVVRARALLAAQAARNAYAELGGKVGSRWSYLYEGDYEAARALVVEADGTD